MRIHQVRVWEDIQVQLRRGLPVAAGLRQCRLANIPVRVVRHHLGQPGNPRFGQAEDVTDEYLAAATRQARITTAATPKGEPA